MNALFVGAIATAYAVRDHLNTPYDADFEAAAFRYKVPSNVLRALARTESNFRADAINRNSNGTEDVGLMQINSTNFAYLGLTKDKALVARLNINAGAR